MNLACFSDIKPFFLANRFSKRFSHISKFGDTALVARPAQHLVILEQMRAILEVEEPGAASFVLLPDPSVDWMICLSRQLGIESCDVEVGGGQIPLDIP